VTIRRSATVIAPTLLVAAVLAACGGSGVGSEAVAGGPCGRGEIFEIAVLAGGGALRCELVEGTSLHSDDPARAARFEWRELPADELETARATGPNVRADGSSTLAPMMTVAAKYFENTSKSVNGGDAVRIAVGISGTGGGFEKFCSGETDLSNASRPIKDEEASQCAANGVEYDELRVALDGLAVVVNNSNDWAKCLTMGELSAIWSPDSTISSWADVRQGFPDEPLRLFGAGTDSGTFDTFSELVGGTAKALRKDVDTSEDDNVTVRGVSETAGGMGYFGLSYAVENADLVHPVEVDSGSGCTEPSEASVQDGSYPLARDLYVYAKHSSVVDNPGARAFLTFLARHSAQIARDALFVPLTDAESAELLRRVVDIGS
jgi:phosphate transport system substrate-binding protein